MELINTFRIARQFSGTESPYTHTFQYEKKPDCPVCGGEVTEITASRDQTLEDFIEDLKARPTVCVAPSLTSLTSKTGM